MDRGWVPQTKGIFRALLLAALAGGSLLMAPIPPGDAAAGASPAQAAVIPGRYVVVLKPGADPPAVVNDHGIVATHVYRYGFPGFAAILSDSQAASLSSDTRVAEIGRDRALTEVADQVIPTGVSRIGATPPLPAGSGGDGVRVAVVDTGIDYNHPDLAANIDAESSCNFVGGRACGPGSPPAWNDGHGHGTHVAGIIAALDNGEGVVGVAPRATLVALRALGNNGAGNLSDVIAALDFIACTRGPSGCHRDGGPTSPLVPPVDVANLSIAATCDVCTRNSTDPTVRAFEKTIHQAVDSGVIVVAAAGNRGVDVATAVPAAFSDVIAVSAFSDLNGAGGPSSGCTSITTSSGKVLSVCDETVAGFSNFGASIGLTAPGVAILSTDLTARGRAGGYSVRTGTSMAGAHVSGVVALVLSARARQQERSLELLRFLQATGECPPGAPSLQQQQLCSQSWPGAAEHREPLVNAQRAVGGG